MAEGFAPSTRQAVQKIPLLTVRAGPRDAPELWENRLKEELGALIKYIQMSKGQDADWFSVTSNKEGTHWHGKCWTMHNLHRHEFAWEFDVPATYPAVSPEFRIPELDGKTAKMYRGGAICLTVHFKPLWAKNSPHFGFAHALCLGLTPWLAAEVPFLVEEGALAQRS